MVKDGLVTEQIIFEPKSLLLPPTSSFQSPYSPQN